MENPSDMPTTADFAFESASRANEDARLNHKRITELEFRLKRLEELVEGHRHGYVAYRDVEEWTGPMQAMENR